MGLWGNLIECTLFHSNLLNGQFDTCTSLSCKLNSHVNTTCIHVYSRTIVLLYNVFSSSVHLDGRDTKPETHNTKIHSHIEVHLCAQLPSKFQPATS